MERYLDNCATTKASDGVVQAMVKMLAEDFGNPSSLHKKGFESELLVTAAKRQLASALAVREDEIIFTSGGTHANNLAILGAARANKRTGKRVVVSCVEHSSVLESAKQLEKEGFDVVYLRVLSDGSVDKEHLAQVVNSDTILVSCMLVNSELGSVNDLAQIATIAKRINPNVLLHSDCVQGFCRVPVNPTKWNVDLVTASAHKIHGPKGVGVLYCKKGVKVQPIIFGAGSGLSVGTQNAPAICGFGVAVAEMQSTKKVNDEKFAILKEKFLCESNKRDFVCINSPANGTPYIMNASIIGLKSEVLIHYLEQKEIYVSSGSACAKGKKSHVLLAVGLPNDRIDSALRISFSKDTKTTDIEELFAALDSAYAQLARKR